MVAKRHHSEEEEGRGRAAGHRGVPRHTKLLSLARPDSFWQALTTSSPSAKVAPTVQQAAGKFRLARLGSWDRGHSHSRGHSRARDRRRQSAPKQQSASCSSSPCLRKQSRRTTTRRGAVGGLAAHVGSGEFIAPRPKLAPWKSAAPSGQLLRRSRLAREEQARSRPTGSRTDVGHRGARKRGERGVLADHRCAPGPWPLAPRTTQLRLQLPGPKCQAEPAAPLQGT